MVEAKVLYEEVVNEIGTQTLARFGLNIFSLNTYGAYGESITAANVVSDTYERHKNNDKFYGQTFEDLDVGQKNILSELLNKNEKSYTTDTLADIAKVSSILASGKKIENLTLKEKKKVEFIMKNYPEELKKINSDARLQKHANKNDPTTDTITFDKAGNIVQKSQHKVIKNTKDLLKDKYLENNDVFTVPFDDYKKHKENLEKMVAQSKDKDERERAKRALSMLDKNNFTNRIMCENPRTTAVITQSIVASGHIAQAGISDAIIVSLSMLANGAIFEIKDAFDTNGSQASMEERIKRLLKKVLKAFREPFARGASFGTLDVAMGALTQIFKSISSKLKYIWRELRTSLKSIFNAVWDFISGKVKNYQELISIIIKGLFSAIMVAFAITLEAEFELLLTPLVSPIIASFLAPALAIMVGSLSIVLMTKSIDLALNTLFGVFAQRDLAKIKADEVAMLCEELMPSLLEDCNELEKLISSTYKERKLDFDKSFEEFTKGLTQNDTAKVILGLQGINSMYGKSLTFETFHSFDECLLDIKSVIKL